MQKLHYGIGLTGPGLLIALGFVWFGGPVPRPQTMPTERSIMPPATIVSSAPVVPQDTAAPKAGQRVDLQAVKDELATVQRQQSDALAALRQQQETKLAVLQQRLERLFTAPHALPQQFDNLALRAASAADASLTADDAGAARAEHATVQVTQTHEAQAVDLIWSTQAETSIEKSFLSYGSELPDAVLLDTDCRTTVCRMEVTFENDTTRHEVLMRLPHMIPWNAHGLLHFEPQTKTVTFYVAREGERLDTAR